jgi:hypothetical protein
VNVLLTFDYELFFGSNSGSVEKCLIQPTERLLQLCESYGVKMTFFLDAGYLKRLKEEQQNHESLRTDYEKVAAQIRKIVETGNEIGFHVHPHWERSFFSNGRWDIVTNGAYKLSDFSQDEINEILDVYYETIVELSGAKPIAFRAGGWCIQPFSLIADKLKSLGIRYDSSVMPGVSFHSNHYAFDFKNAPDKSMYAFEHDECKEEFQGFFTEVPISSQRYTPLFFWKLYVLGRLFPSRHKMLGDGNFLAQPGRKKRSLTESTVNHVSTDGYFASELESYHQKELKVGRDCSVVIGHPKSMTEFSFEKLEGFISKNRNKLRFITFSNVQ